MPNKTTISRNYGVLVAVLLSAILIVINVLRIKTIPATHDEVIFFTKLNTSYSDIINFNVIVTANVHPLSFMTSKFFVETFSNDLFYLRLGSLLAQIAYLFFSWRICAHLFKNAWWQVLLFVMLQLNPFLFDFWALNRGYAMAIAFMTISVYYLLRFADRRHLGYFTAGLLAAVCAGYSNFAFMYYYIAFAGVATLIMLYNATKDTAKKVLLPAMAIMLTVTWLLYELIHVPIQKLRDANELYYGGETGFFSDTVVSLTKESLFATEASNAVAPILGLFAAVAVIVNGAYLLIKISRKQMTAAVMANAICWLLLIAPAMAITVQFNLNGTKYVTDRTALFFYVLFALTLSTWLFALTEKNNTLFTRLTIPLLVLTVYNFASNLSITDTWQWAYDRNSVAVLERMKTSYKGHQLHLRSWSIFAHSLNYHVYTQYSTYFDTVISARRVTDLRDTSFDYYYIPMAHAKYVPGNYVTDTVFTTRNTDMDNGEYVLMKRVNTIVAR